MHRDELRESRNFRAKAGLPRNAETVGRRATHDGLPVAQERIAFAAHSIELRIHQPGVLHELELARDVGIQADEMQTALRVAGRSRKQSVFAGQAGAVLAASSYDPMKAG